MNGPASGGAAGPSACTVDDLYRLGASLETSEAHDQLLHAARTSPHASVRQLAVTMLKERAGPAHHGDALVDPRAAGRRAATT